MLLALPSLSLFLPAHGLSAQTIIFPVSGGPHPPLFSSSESFHWCISSIFKEICCFHGSECLAGRGLNREHRADISYHTSDRLLLLMLVSLYCALIFHTASSTTEDEKSLNQCHGFGIANTNVIFRSIFISALSLLRCVNVTQRPKGLNCSETEWHTLSFPFQQLRIVLGTKQSRIREEF